MGWRRMTAVRSKHCVPADAVWFAPGERHWHGAADDSPFSYISVQPTENGSIVEWLQPVEGQS